MKNHQYLGKGIALLTATAMTVGVLVPVTATTSRSTSSVKAPNSLQHRDIRLAQLIGACRAVSTSIPVQTGRSTTSEVVATLNKGTIVKLSDNGANGWVRISTPVVGFVQAGYLSAANCPTPPPPANDRCRRVARPPEGLKIRRGPTITSDVLGGVQLGQTVTLTTNPPTTQRDNQGRDWVNISSPISGWITNGLATSTVSNLVYCK